jgi:hypothetical protein
MVFKKSMESISVSVDEEGNIRLETPDYGGGEQVIAFPPEQADTLIEWIQKAKAAALEI